VPSVSVNGCELYYQLHGSGPPLVFIHGETHGMEMFEETIAHFCARHTCLAYYRRGHGKSELPAFGYSLWNNSVDLAALLERLDISQPVIVACAMSTPIAVTYALHHGKNVRGLVLCSWYEIEGYPAFEKRRGKSGIPMSELRMHMEQIAKTGGREALERFMEENRHGYFPIFPKEAGARAKVVQMFSAHPPGHYMKSAEYYSSLPNLLHEMHLIRCPILGICGTDDPSPDDPALLAHLANFRQEWIEGARRFPMIEKPAAFNAVLERFLATS
jgi:3-oxoadipate enol-lactonase